MNDSNLERCREAIISNEYADFFVREERVNEVISDFNVVCLQTLYRKYRIAHTPVTNMDRLQAFNYGYLSFPKLYGLMDTTNMENIGVNRLRRLEYLDLYGNGVLIGFIDTGINYTMDVFKNPGNTSRVLRIWDQEIQTGLSPQGFNYGTEYTKEQLDAALQAENPLDVVPSTDTNGHGSFMAGIAAGNIDRSNDFTGAAPQAELLVVKLKQAKQYLRDYYYIREDAVAYQETDIVLGIKYLLQTAQQQGKPLVICIGLGTNAGGHTGDSILGEYISATANYVGVCTVVPTGNEANYGLHYRGRELDIEEYEDVEIRVGENERGFALELWGQSPSVYSVGLISPSGEIADRIPARIENSQVLRFIFENTVVYVDYRLLETQTGDQLIFFRFARPSPGIWKIRIYKETNFNNYFDLWLPIRDFLGQDTYFIRPNPDITITEPGNTELPITIAAFDHSNNSIYLNSGRGYTRDGRVKPDIAAPGVNVYGPLLNNTFGVRSGTSIAAAHAAGAAALLLEWGVVDGNRPQLDTLEIKSLFMKGANRTNQDYPNNIWGYGTLDIYGAFNSLRITV